MPQNNFDQVILSLQSDRALVPANQTNDRYILLTVQSPERDLKTDRLPLNLSLIIDRSGSMSGKKLEYVKEAVTHVLRMLTPTDRLSIVTYDDEVKLLAASQALSSAARQRLIEQVRQIRSGGMTNLSGGWLTGCEQIKEYQSQEYVNRAFLLTDGLANQGITDHEELVFEGKKLRKNGISTSTFGVGNTFNEFLLQGIADGGGGHFYFIDTPNQIPNYFKGELGELLTTVAREMTLDISLPAGVTVELLNEIPTESSDGRLRVLLGDTYAGDSRTLLFKVSLPACNLRQYLSLGFTLQYEDAQHRRAVAVKTDPVIFSAVSENAYHQQAVNEAVLREAAELETERAKMEALRQVDQRNLAGARATVKKAKSALADFSIAAAPLEAELDKLADGLEGMTVQERKTMHYGTYNRQQSRKDYKKQ
ncbi:VWA domain-containing protein [Anaerolineales bacterium HSG24]|nr:VWA domain-containing protein [Anaerolineales bacterium HSG24]